MNGELLAPAAEAGAFMAIIQRAAEAPDFDVERITRLLELKERWERGEALKAYAAAKVAFKQAAPQLSKNKHVKFTNSRGTLTEYDHATHDEVNDKVSDALARHGITHSWSIAQAEGGVSVTCTLLHERGHTEAVTMSADNDASGGKNSIQAIASANSYLQRYTLLAVTGLSTSDMPNDDGRDSGTLIERPAINPDVWLVLNEAAAQGNQALADMWIQISNDTRKMIVTHYAVDWANLKALAALKP